ncbi:MAG: hypothetical protein KDI30_11720 [Pseudomonadales bacterium]|nr:hypothetical protein [Pseudomonadales bacterium]
MAKTTSVILFLLALINGCASQGIMIQAPRGFHADSAFSLETANPTEQHRHP